VSGQVDTTVLAAFAVGFVSFISPCVLPLVPGYLSTVSGVSVAELQGEKRPWRVLGPAVVFCLSFTTVFVALGMTATGLGSALQDSRGTLDKVAGVVIIALGVLFVLTPFVPRLNREWRPDALIRRAGAGGPIIAGLAFAVAWTPCVGPILGSTLALATTRPASAFPLLLAYAAGLGAPFLLVGLFPARAFSFLKRHRKAAARLHVAFGFVLVGMGVLVFTNKLSLLANFQLLNEVLL
jgi:cytochrome c-type biogenesis protein